MTARMTFCREAESIAKPEADTFGFAMLTNG